MKKKADKIEEAPTPEPTAEEPKPRFLGDPIHAQALLSDPERRNEGIKYVAEHGYHRWAESDKGDFAPLESGYDDRTGKAGKPSVKDFDDLDDLHKAGLYAMVQAIVNDPHAEPYASSMPANSDRKAYRALDDALRDAMGYSRFNHA